LIDGTNLPSFVVSKLELESFRQFKSLSQEWGKINVLVGANGSGKSGLLLAIAAGFAKFVSVFEPTADYPNIVEADLSFGSASGIVELQVSYSQHLIKTQCHLRRSGNYWALPVWPNSALVNEIPLFWGGLVNEDATLLPVIAFYPARRVAESTDITFGVNSSPRAIQLYSDAFDGERQFTKFQSWFRTAEDLENQFRARDQSYRDSRLTAVRSAMEVMMPGFHDLRFERTINRMVIDKENQTLDLSQLSDGEQNLIALAGDISRRLAIANPNGNPLHGYGVVLIDELEQHLHPSWQRRSLKALETTFPNLQFFITTHSPIIAASAPPNSLYLVHDGTVTPKEAYGQDVALVLDEVFGTASRDEEVQKRLDDLFSAITLLDANAPEHLYSLEHLLGTNDPLLVRARTRMRGLGLL
jgi:predicted ATP-binding protein involved in virulence